MPEPIVWPPIQGHIRQETSCVEKGAQQHKRRVAGVAAKRNKSVLQKEKNEHHRRDSKGQIPRCPSKKEDPDQEKSIQMEQINKQTEGDEK